MRARPLRSSSPIAVSIPDFDREHQELFRLADELRQALAAKARMPPVESLFHELAARTAEHFAHEEREMEATGYAHGAWHRRQHAAANKEMARMGRRIQRGDREAATLLLDFLARSLAGHIAVADRMLNAHLRNYQRARAAKAG